MVALAATACAADAGRVKDYAAPATSLPASAATRANATDMPQGSSSSVEPTAVAPELLATVPQPTQAPVPTAVLPVIGPAPGWDNEVWINSEGPLLLEDLRGKVVLLEFWTFG